MAGKRPANADAVPDLARETSPKVLADWVRSALRLDRPDILHAAVRQLCRCQDMKLADPLERAFTAQLLALEQALADDSATRRRIVRTRMKLEREGPERVLAELVLKSRASDGFLKMVAYGQVENSPEALVLAHHARFDAAVTDAARQRLQEYGFDADQPA